MGGEFDIAGSEETENLAKWDGTTFSAVEGLPAHCHGPRAMAAFDAGDGPKLYVGGWIETVAGLPTKGSRSGTGPSGHRPAWG